MPADTIKITRNCRACGQPMHLVQDSSGSEWMHDHIVDEYKCFRDNRAQYEDGTL